MGGGACGLSQHHFHVMDVGFHFWGNVKDSRIGVGPRIGTNANQLVGKCHDWFFRNKGTICKKRFLDKLHIASEFGLHLLPVCVKAHGSCALVGQFLLACTPPMWGQCRGER